MNKNKRKQSLISRFKEERGPLVKLTRRELKELPACKSGRKN